MKKDNKTFERVTNMLDSTVSAIHYMNKEFKTFEQELLSFSPEQIFDFKLNLLNLKKNVDEVAEKVKKALKE